MDLAEAEDLARISLGTEAELLLQRCTPRMFFGKIEVALPPGALTAARAPSVKRNLSAP